MDKILVAIFREKRLEQLKQAAEKSGCEMTIIGKPGDTYQEGGLTFTVLHGYKRVQIYGNLTLFHKELEKIDQFPFTSHRLQRRR